MQAKELNFENFSPYFSYEPETGILRWAVSRPPVKVGSVAGSLKRCGYIRVTINGESHQASRVAWLLFHKNIDRNLDVDHIDRDRTNNRISNLRLVPHSENCMNKRTNLGEDSPRYYTKHKTGKYQVVIKGRYAGLFETEQEAINVIRSMK